MAHEPRIRNKIRLLTREKIKLSGGRVRATQEKLRFEVNKYFLRPDLFSVCLFFI